MTISKADGGQDSTTARAVEATDSDTIRRSAPFSWSELDMANRTQLCTYADSIGQNLSDLKQFLNRPELEGVIHGLHLLPMCKSTDDRGFAPKNYMEIDPKFGTCEDVQELTAKFDLTVDLMVNHIGRSSDEFQDFVRFGKSSPYASLFIFWDDVFHGMDPSPDELDTIYARKPAFPHIDVEHFDGSTSRIWNTFGPDQLDLNPATPLGREYICNAIKLLAKQGAKVIRLDAVGYITKKRGTRCFFNEPDIWHYLDYMQAAASEGNVQLLAEVHEHNSLRLKLAERGLWVYDFCLPMLVLNALHRSDAAPLRRWLAVCPFRQFTCLDTHDGVGVPDVEDVMTPQQIKGTEEAMCGCKETLQWTYNSKLHKFVEHNTGVGTTHQHNCTFYSSIQGRAHWYLLARAIQVFTPGIPMVYYVGLLAGSNDVVLAQFTKSDRFLNRHYYTLPEALNELHQPVVRSLLGLLHFRNTYPAFLGEMLLDNSADHHKLRITWEHKQAAATLTVDLSSKEWGIEFKNLDSGQVEALNIGADKLMLSAAACTPCSMPWF